MTTAPPNPPSDGKPMTRLGVVLRVSFFVALVFISLQILPLLFYQVLGLIAAGSLGLFGAAFLANFLTIRIFDRRPFGDIGLPLNIRTVQNLALGLLLGGGTAALMLTAPLLAGTGHLVPKPGSTASVETLGLYFCVLAIAATGEEMIFRGYAFQLLVQKIGPFATVLPVAVIFGLVHNSNPHASLLGIINTILFGIILGYAFLRSHDLWLPIGIHFGWNCVLPLFGANLSGLTIEVTRYYYRWELSPLLSGGEYGPEGGLLTTIFAVGLFVLLTRVPVGRQHAAIAEVLNEDDPLLLS